MIAETAMRKGCGLSMSSPKNAVTARQVTDLHPFLVGQAVRDELAQPTVGSEHAECPL